MDCIKTFALIAAQNPLMQDASESYNKKANHSLTGQLKSARIPYVPVKGKFGGNFSQLSQQLKFAFPFSIFDSICRKISDNVSTSGFEVGSCDLGNTMTRLHKRSQVYKGVQELIDSSL